MNLVSAGPVETPAAGGIPGFDELASIWGEQAPLGWDTSDPTPVADADLLPALGLVARDQRRDRPRGRRLPRDGRAAESAPASILPAVLLAVDVGNTQTHVGMFRGDELVEHWRFATVPEATADELATVLAGLLALRELKLGDVHGAMVSAVVPRARARVRPADRALPERQRRARRARS